MPKAPDYLSPHCASGKCAYCRRRRAEVKAASIEARRAAAAPSMFDYPWGAKIGGNQEHLGPPGLETFVKR